MRSNLGGASQERPDGENGAGAVRPLEGLFGGMKVVRGRKRRSAGSTAASHTTCTELSTSFSAKEANAPAGILVEEKPFLMRLKLPSTSVKGKVETPRRAQMRQRLEKIFLENCPEMLPQMEAIIEKNIDCADELFRQLESTYGPEPTQLLSGFLPRENELFFLGPVSEVESGFDFIASGVKKQTHDTFDGDSTSGSLAFGAPGMPLDAVQSDRRQSFTESACSHAEGTGKVQRIHFDIFTTASPVAAAGSNFAAQPGPCLSFVVSHVSTEEKRAAKVHENDRGVEEEEEKGILQSRCNDAGFSNQDRSKDHNSTTGTVTTTAVNSDQKKNDNCRGIDDINENATWEDIRGSSRGSPSDAVGEPETLSERHQREIQLSHGEVLSARADLSRAVDSIRLSIEQRRDVMEQISNLEHRMEQCVVQEAFEEADVLSGELQQLGRQVAELDAAPVRLLASLTQCRDRLAEKVRGLSRLLQRHSKEILESKDDEEWRVKKIIYHTKFRLENQGKSVAAALERAKLVEGSAMRETRGLCERKAKSKEKLLRQCQELQTVQEELLHEKSNVDAEIVALELKLANLRQTSAKLAVKLQGVTSDLQHLITQHEVLEGEMDDCIKHEEERLRDATASIKQLHEESEALCREERDFEARSALMLAELSSGAAKIDAYKRRCALLESETLTTVLTFGDALAGILQMRAAGRGVLFSEPSPSLSSSLDAVEGVGESPISPVHILQRQLRALDAEREECEARVASFATQLAEMQNRMLLLEAGKRSAAQAKRFKEAQLKADELRLLATSIAELSAASSSAQETLRSNAIKRMSLQEQLSAECAAATERARDFLSRYSDELDVAATANVAPNVLQFPAEEQGADDLAEATQRLMATLRRELEAAASRPGGEETTVKNARELSSELPQQTGRELGDGV